MWSRPIFRYESLICTTDTGKITKSSVRKACNHSTKTCSSKCPLHPPHGWMQKMEASFHKHCLNPHNTPLSYVKTKIYTAMKMHTEVFRKAQQTAVLYIDINVDKKCTVLIFSAILHPWVWRQCVSPQSHDRLTVDRARVSWGSVPQIVQNSANRNR